MANEVAIKIGIEGAEQGNKQVLQLADGFDRLKVSANNGSASADRLAGAIGRVAHYGIAGASIHAIASSFMNVSMALLEASSSAQRLTTQLNFATDGRGAKEMQWVGQIANELGLNLNSTAKAYAGFASAARGTALQGQATRDVFEAIAKASAVMGLSGDETTGALLAVQQMMSKGVVSAEEFRGQLGERMPIALQAGAQALGVTTAEFSKMMAEGKIVAADFLPKFASAINSMLGESATEAANRLDAATQRMGTSWQKLKQTVGDSSISAAVSNEISGMSNYMTALSDAIDNAKKSGSGFVGQMNAGLAEIIARAPFDVMSASANMLNSTINGLTGGVMHLNTNVNLLPDALNTNAHRAALLDQKLSDAKTELAKLQQQLAAAPEDIYLKSATYQAYLLVQQLEAAKRAKNELGAGGGRGSVNPQTIGDREAEQEKLVSDLSALRTKLSGVPEEYIKTMQEIGRLHAAGVLMGKDYTDAIDNAHKLLKTAHPAITEMQKGMELYNDLMAKSVGVNANYSEEQAKLTAAYRGGKLTLDQYSQAMNELIKQQPYMTAIHTADAKAQEALNKTLKDYAEHQQKSVVAAYDEVDKAQAAYDAHGKLASVIQQENLARLENYRLAITMGAGDSAELAVIDAQIDAKRRLIDILKRGELRDTIEVSAKAAAEEWQKTTEQIGQSLTDQLMQGGRNAADYLKNLFRTLVLRPIIMAGVGSLTGGMASAATAVGAGSGGNMLGVAGNLASMYNMATAGMSAIGNLGATTIANGVGAMGGDALGTLAALKGAGSANMAALGTAANYLGAAGMGVFVGGLISGGKSAIGGNSNTATVGGAAIGAMIAGPIGAFVGGVAGGFVNAAFGHGATELTSSGTRGTFSGTSFSGVNYANYHQDGGWFSSDNNWSDITQMDTAALQAWSDSFASVKASMLGAATALGLATDQVAAYSKAVDIAAGTTADQLTAIFTGMADDMAKAAAPAIADLAKTGETASATLSRLSNSLTTANTWLSMLGKQQYDVSMNGADAASALADAFGSVDNLASSSKAYYEAYYTQSERAQRSAVDLAKSLALVNVALPESKQAFRDLISSLDLTTEAGRNAYAVMLSVAPEFSSLADAVTSMTDSVVAEVKRIRSLIASESPASYAAAQTQFSIATAQARAGDAAALSSLPDLSKSLLSLAETNAATAVDLARVRALTASSLEMTASLVAGTYGLKLPSYDVGTNYVPRDMVAQIHKGEAIIPRAFNPVASGHGTQNQELVSELRSLRAENAAMRSELQAIAMHASKTARILDRVTRNGESMQTVAVV